MLPYRGLPSAQTPKAMDEEDEEDEVKHIQSLLELHYTHRKAMEGSPLYQKHDSFQKQTSNFQKLLQHAINKFSKEKLNHMLRAVSRGAPYMESTKKYEKDNPQRITSLRELREIISEIKAESEKKYGLQREDEVQLIKYFETYFDDLDYLQSLKKNFDEKIYVCLYDYFYDPEDDVEGQFDILNRNKHGKTDDELSSAEDSGYSTHESGDEKKQEKALQRIPEGPDVILDNLTDKQKLSYAVRELFRINHQWDQLFDEDHIDPACFDDDSHHELLLLKDYMDYEDVLRVVPDAFVKAHKSLELARLWWTQANKVYKQLPPKRNSTVEFNKKAGEYEKCISKIRDEMLKDEVILKNLMEELETLKQRENKYNYLSDVCEQMEEERDNMDQRHSDIEMRRDALKRKVDGATKGSRQYEESKKKLMSCDRELIMSQSELDGLTYKLKILRLDFDCALQIRPDMIFFAADVSEKITKLQGSLGEKRKEKRQVEKKLVLLRTNCDRMRQIMRKYIRSVDIHDRRNRQQEVDASEDDMEIDTHSPTRLEEDKQPRKKEDDAQTWKVKKSVHHRRGSIQKQERDRVESEQDLGSHYSNHLDDDRGGKNHNKKPDTHELSHGEEEQAKRPRYNDTNDLENGGIVMKPKKFTHRESRIPQLSKGRNKSSGEIKDSDGLKQNGFEENGRQKNVTFTQEPSAVSPVSMDRNSTISDDDGTDSKRPKREVQPSRPMNIAKDNDEGHARSQPSVEVNAYKPKTHEQNALSRYPESPGSEDNPRGTGYQPVNSNPESSKRSSQLSYLKNKHHLTNDSILNRKPFPRNTKAAPTDTERSRAKENLNY